MAEHPVETSAPAGADAAHTRGSEVAHGGAEHHGPSLLGIEAAGIVSLAMLIVLIGMLWKKVPSTIGKSLDAKIEQIRTQLAEAETLRKEAEALKAEYQAKADAAGSESEAMLARARAESDAIIAKAQSDAEALVARRTKMAEDKIAAEEMAAVNELRALAANAASKAAARLISERHDAAADQAVIDRTIGEIAAR
ncbi:F0F1 ATP synthase subunit B [Sphingomonas piscis]|uniref:ATP synthase subunit b n=1 Tax=Sphingomonas piscis TaxID=2714943 RepID=A0A6G7YRQ3_9SPHN|nr:F0F1 ATP synthase subunit B [Sphingomonas piscis]QIK79412.1 F0F1 ATP synthase subunit B [Sphingomonas piscis]